MVLLFTLNLVYDSAATKAHISTTNSLRNTSWGLQLSIKTVHQWHNFDKPLTADTYANKLPPGHLDSQYMQ